MYCPDCGEKMEQVEQGRDLAHCEDCHMWYEYRPVAHGPDDGVIHLFKEDPRVQQQTEREEGIG